ncbi:hypothetical protein Lalb_Chr10g0097851 [Lupinus albus]|uniref:Uncharacterized protein n=1 Tax=Lupinus albus TaxID=3870 RepID=A0A6A4PW08_LUPAL|nr:hypothetical protein Lalb_Chr10g0097851 [Lupinus albus]
MITMSGKNESFSPSIFSHRFIRNAADLCSLTNDADLVRCKSLMMTFISSSSFLCFASKMVTEISTQRL